MADFMVGSGLTLPDGVVADQHLQSTDDRT
jgi:hypothetical protein